MDELSQLQERILELERSQSLYQKTEKTGKIGGWQFDPVTLKQSWTDQVFRILEIDLKHGAPEVPKGLEFIDPEFRPMAERAIQGAMEHGRPYDQEWMVTTARGNKKWVNAVCKPKTKGGKVVSVSGSFQDITSKKAREEQLKALNQQLQASEQQLRAANQQLQANEQQLRTANQQLQANEQQLRAANQQLQANEQQLRSANQQLQANEQQLRAANQQLQASEQQLIESNKALSHSRDLMKYIIEHNRSAVAVHDKELKFIYVSQRYLQEYNVIEKDIIGRHHYDIFPDLPQKWRDVHKKALLGEVSSADDDPYYKEDGTLEWTRWECRPWYEQENVVGGFIIYTEVITERKNIELALKAAKEKAEVSESKYRNLVETASDAIYLASEDGTIIDTNQGAIDMLGKGRDEIVGQSIVSIDPNYPGKEYLDFWKDVPFDQQHRFESTHLHKNGDLIPVELSAKKYRQDDKVYYYSVARDITERKQSEAELKKIEWLLRPKEVKTEAKIPDYGDLTMLNQDRTILDSVGKEVLNGIVSDYLSLLDTSAAVYERNGDYAVGIFSSEWCRFLDCSSRGLCKSEDNRKALESGKWLCHESCWSEASHRAMQTNKAVDIECNGGLHIYAIPIQANHGVTGAINFGYGDPPTTEDKLTEIAARYKVSLDKLKDLARNYETRPAFIIDIAKEKLESSARLIGKIVELKQMEEELLLNQKRYQNAESIGKVGNWEYDPVSSTFWTSDQGKRIYGFNPNTDGFSTEMVESCIPERERVHRALVELLEHNKKYDIVFDIITKDKGIRKTIHSMAEVARDTQGRAMKVTGVIIDITQSKYIEKELIIAKEKAEESDRLKSAFLANMSHEIRTPMNGIMGFADLLKKKDLTGEQQQKFIEIIQKSGDRMLNTVNDIIDISRIESGLVELSLSEVNIRKQLEDLLSFFSLEAGKKDIQLVFKNDISEWDGNVITDPEKFNSIITNLIKNAIKFTNQGIIELGYSIENAHGAAEVLFYVKDTGIGIPGGRQEAIFDRFIQADIEDKQANQGSGLGLAISKAYAEMLGGKIWVDSKEGEGSTFYFTMQYNHGSDSKLNTEHVEPVSEEDHISVKLKILLVEDDETSKQLMSIVLEKFAEKILYVSTGLEAVTVCRENPDIDLIFMDIQLPGISGYEATRQIRQFNNDVIIIAQTAFALAGDREKAIKMGCNDYVSKPISEAELDALVKKYSMNYPSSNRDLLINE